MNKTSSFIKILKYINRSINNLLEKNLNRLNFNNLINLFKNNKIILIFVALFVLFLSYLLLPTFYKQDQISRELRNDLQDKFNLSFTFTKQLNYSFFPRPHFTTNDAIIKDKDFLISEVKKTKIYVSLDNLFSFKNIEVKDLNLEKANFNFNKKNYNFFIKLLGNSFAERSLNIKNGNIFFRDDENKVLFIKQILNLKYYYDANELKNIIYAKNKIFNIPYSIETYLKNNGDTIFSKINLNFLKLQVINEVNINKEIKVGNSDFIFNKIKSSATYKIKKNYFEYNIFDKLDLPTFAYKGEFNFKPFYSSLNGDMEEIKISPLFDVNSLIPQLLKTEIFNNKNIDFRLNINADKVYNNINFKNIKLNSNIKEGLIDVDNTKFEWRNFVNFTLSETLIYVKEGELVLDGKLKLDIKDYKEIYKFLLTPKNYRNEIKKINLNFTYNFDRKIANLKDIRVDDKINHNLNKTLNNVILKRDKLQNKIYFKNLFNEAIKNYSG